MTTDNAVVYCHITPTTSQLAQVVRDQLAQIVTATKTTIVISDNVPTGRIPLGDDTSTVRDATVKLVIVDGRVDKSLND